MGQTTEKPIKTLKQVDKYCISKKMLMQSSNYIRKHINLARHGRNIIDKLIIFIYLFRIPLNLILEKLGIEYKRNLMGNVTVKSEDGIFFCGNNLMPVWMGGGFHEKELRKYFDIKKDNFIDIGANVGMYTIILGKRLQNKGKVIAIEPHPINFKILEKNIKLNKLNNVILENCACSDKEGKINFYLDKKGTGGHSLIKNIRVEEEDHIKVDVKKLDTIVRKNKIKKVKLIKIDVEGAELDVLKGATKILKESHPKIIFEAWDKEYLGKIEKFLKKFDYKIKKLDEKNFLAY